MQRVRHRALLVPLTCLFLALLLSEIGSSRADRGAGAARLPGYLTRYRASASSIWARPRDQAEYYRYPVVEDGPSPRLLIECGPLVFAPRVAPDRLALVVRANVVLAPSVDPTGTGVLLRAGDLVRLRGTRGGLAEVTYSDYELTSTGYVPRSEVGHTFKTPPPYLRSVVCRSYVRGAELMDAPRGKAFVQLAAGGEPASRCARALGPKTDGYAQVRVETPSHSVVGWIDRERIEDATGRRARRPEVRMGHPCGAAGSGGPDLVELNEGALLREMPGGETVGLARGGAHLARVEARGRWVRLRVDTPFGPFLLWTDETTSPAE